MLVATVLRDPISLGQFAISTQPDIHTSFEKESSLLQELRQL